LNHPVCRYQMLYSILVFRPLISLHCVPTQNTGYTLILSTSSAINLFVRIITTANIMFAY
jgi:hypothetical protein